MKRRFVLLIALLLLCFISCGHAEGGGVEVLVRGSTAVVRIPCDWLQDYAVEKYPPERRPYGFDSRKFIADDEWLWQNLNETEYEAFKTAYSENGFAAYLKIRDVGILCDFTNPKYDRLQMNKRLLDNAWYLIFRQEPLNFNVDCVVYYPTTIFAEKEIEVIIHADGAIPGSMINVETFSGKAGEVFRKGDCTFEIFSGLGTNIAVITKPLRDGKFIKNATLQIGEGISVDVSGYTQSKQAIYCCVLTDSELQALENATDIQLVAASAERDR